MGMPNPWFRLYSEIIDDEKLLLLAFQDRWHFVALLALKNRGVLDENEGEMLHRKLCVKLGLHKAELEELGKRLSDVGLIDRATFQPLAWDDRQFRSDGSTERVRKYRERMKRFSNVTVTAQDTDTDTDTEKKRASKPASRFRPPSLDEVRQYCSERNSPVSPESFVNWYQSIGWRVSGKTPMKDWKAAVRTWEQREGKTNGAAAKLPSGNSLDAQIELGRLCKTAGISADRVSGKSCDQIRALLKAEGVAS
jgi:hypothetical protein